MILTRMTVITTYVNTEAEAEDLLDTMTKYGYAYSVEYHKVRQCAALHTKSEFNGERYNVRVITIPRNTSLITDILEKVNDKALIQVTDTTCSDNSLFNWEQFTVEQYYTPHTLGET